ncbi:MAG: sensor domain-containing diguanylate cyclase [Methylophilaceae bacterium 17-44-8]|nr:MAG: sensor domain-containing diguanylate cyclase [Methylophilales bacterium 28-44-11]OYY83835.1 MAG: sensor domain-containing diguanylate cyclase [Methylophilales bacterium 16-45-9]OZA05296.1 MAG: sensor domain-containing diguanylate cyclase [Methylophilaceae bacterium 17-44-8]
MSDDLQADYQSLLQFLYMAPVGLVQMQADGNIVMINPLSAQLLLPITPDGDLTNFFKTLEDIAPELQSLCVNFKKKRGQICDSLRVQLSAGIPGKEDAKFLAFTLLKLDADRFMAVINDVTLLVKRERQLQQNEAWFNAIFTGVSDYAIASLDTDGIIERWNVSLERLTKFEKEDVEKHSYGVFFPEDATNQVRLKDRLMEADQNGWDLQEGWCLRKDGGRFWGSSIISPLVDAYREPLDPPRYSLIIRDIDEKRSSTEDIMKASFNDHLTGISNRRAFFEVASIEFERWKKRPRPLSLLAIDADHFKKVNDTYGHATGDEVLKHLSKILQHSVRTMDIVARLGGEEFGALLPSTDLEGALKIAERIRTSIADAEVVVDGQVIRYTVSIGVSAVDEHVTGVDMLLKLADEALYVSKHQGRNRVTVATGITSEVASN